MTRITESQTKDLMEAYAEVYAPQQELTEEQVWEEVENWVNSLLEEGYDLSDYTWEEMYDLYEDEYGRGGYNLGTQVRGALGGLVRNVRGTAGAIRRGFTGTQTSRTDPISRAGNAYTRTITAPARAGVRFVQGLSGAPSPYGQGNRPAAQPPATRQQAPAPPQQAPARPWVRLAPAPRQQTPAPSRPAAPAPARPAAPAPGATATPPKPTASTSATPAATSPTAPAPSTPRPKDTSITDMIGRSQVRQGAPINTGNASSDARTIAARASVGAMPSSTSTPKPKPSGGPRTRAQVLGQSFDPFDVVIGHLLDEGYADTEESALAIMANMSEEWRQSIVEGLGSAVVKTVGKTIGVGGQQPTSVGGMAAPKPQPRMGAPKPQLTSGSGMDAPKPQPGMASPKPQPTS